MIFIRHGIRNEKIFVDENSIFKRKLIYNFHFYCEPHPFNSVEQITSDSESKVL